MIPHYQPRERMEREQHFRYSQAQAHSPNYRRNAPENILPSIGSLLGDLGRGPMPPVPQAPYPTYTPGSPVRNPPAIIKYIDSSDEPWSTHKQGQKHPLPVSPTPHYPKLSDHYPKLSDHYPKLSDHSPPTNEISDFLRPGRHSNYGFGSRSKSGLSSPGQMSPTSETTYSFQDSEVNTEVCSESEFTSGVCDTHSQAGSSVSQMFPKQFVCRKCGSSFKCDSLLRKHDMKHTKPFRCPMSNCKRQIQGFTSANDRDRHMNSVHKRSSGRSAVGFDCMYGSCVGNGKIFWRLDNFRNHLKKKHAPKEGEPDEFLKRAESECRRNYSNQPTGTESAMDTQSESGYTMPPTPIESPGPAIPEDFHQAKRLRLIPPVPPFVRSYLGSEGGMIPISPVSRGPGRDLASNPGDQMDLDDTPAPTEPGVTMPSLTERTIGPSNSVILSQAHSSAQYERLDQAKASSHRDPRAEDRSRRLGELHEQLKRYPRILEEYRGLRREELEERGDAAENWPQYDGYLNPIGGSEISARTLSASKGRSTPNKDRSIEHELDRIGENDQDRTEHESSRMSRNDSHALKKYVGQSPTDESPMSRMLSSSSAASAAAIPTNQAENQGPLISPPVSVASPHEISHQRPDPPTDNEILAPRAQRRSSPVLSTPTQPAHTFPSHNEKAIVCMVCNKSFTMKSKLRKHMKRHSRPYACTFRGCGKFFGSKNDWKRHENSQHFQLEIWKCGVHPPGSASLCGKLSFRRESHTTHLKKIHNITDKNDITEKTKQAHIGRNNFKTFWCGFCPSSSATGPNSPRGCVVALNKKGLEGWDERFDHLGRHFIQEDLQMNDYEFGEGEYSQDLSSEDEDSEGEGAESMAQALSDDAALDDLGNGGNAANDEQKVLECTAPDDDPKESLVKVPKTQKPRNSKGPDKTWYCCGGGGSGQCVARGPYSEALHESCITCEHQKCSKCDEENTEEP